jgi:hypothetical protein
MKTLERSIVSENELPLILLFQQYITQSFRFGIIIAIIVLLSIYASIFKIS